MTESGDEGGDFTQMRLARNRKQRKAGGWQAIGLDQSVLRGVTRLGFRQPTPIQRRAIPPIIEGRDVVAMSRTGSGKTAAFVIPVLQRLKQRSMTGVRAVLVAPTRELALQTFKVTKELGRFTGLRCAVLVGGDSIEEQFAAIHENPDILIATPGRLLHVVVEMNLRLSSVEMVVFDEADRLFEMGFAEQLQEVLKRIPESKQTLLFSATLPKLLVEFAKAGLTHPLLVRLDVDATMSEHLQLSFLACRDGDRLAVLLQLLRQEESRSPNSRTIVFCATMKHVEVIAAVLRHANVQCSFLYSQLDAVARNIFRDRHTRVLVVTDVAARGVDIPLVENAINYHFPCKAKLFVHRVGRVARAGQPGHAISFFSPDELPYLADVFLFLGRPLNFVNDDSVGDGKEDGLIGNVPDDVVQIEAEFLKATIENSEEMIDLQQKATNAMSKYMRTRPPPSAESIRRVKCDLRSTLAAAGTHPIFARGEGRGEKGDGEQRAMLIKELRNFKPTTTIFEFQSGSKQQPAAVMKRKRKEHDRYIHRKAVEGAESVGGGVDNADRHVQCKLEEADLEEQAVFDDVISERKFRPMADSSKSKKAGASRRAQMLERERAAHFIAYAPSDAHAERALAVNQGEGFDDAAKRYQMDIVADEERDLQRQKSRTKTWDRKLKRFVGDANDDPAKKKIRTEDGVWLPASYKSGRYERWQNKQQIIYREGQAGEMREEEDGGESSNAFSSGRRRGRGRFSGGRGGGSTASMRGGGGGDGKRRPVRSELKGREEMLKQRKRKAALQDYQRHRRGENMKRGRRDTRGGAASRSGAGGRGRRGGSRGGSRR